ncbi:MAG TPA: BadF/BadG/BcrA/BcrD ATPase family protein [Saprospiraceae bacterium]|nr:BadF/BadG/BcrA/BcrD ATPase family protein [Saprospiraceae bacterium]
MKTMLIGDIGSTKAQWAWLSRDREVTFETIGFNPVMHDPELLSEMLTQVQDRCRDDFTEMYYYGTGIISDTTRKQVIDTLRKVFGKVEISCESDMLGAARALSAGKEGVICILGTGSNSCLFDGKIITRQIPSLGFPLGDEGSGADIGKACVRAFYYGFMTDEVRTSFAEMLPDDRSFFLYQYHQHKTPNRFLAGLVPLVVKHLDSALIQAILEERFRTFTRLHVKPYQASFPVHFTGGVAHAFGDVLQDILRDEKLIPGTIVKSPLSGLIEFHQNNQA